MQDLDLDQTTNGPGAGFHNRKARARRVEVPRSQAARRVAKAAAFKQGSGDPMPR
jgi:hypothetical protein